MTKNRITYHILLVLDLTLILKVLILKFIFIIYFKYLNIKINGHLFKYFCMFLFALTKSLKNSPTSKVVG